MMSDVKEWPKHPDGRNKRLGEMSNEDRRAMWQQAVDRLREDKPFWQSIEKVLTSPNTKGNA
jgi:hypothetical protein